VSGLTIGDILTAASKSKKSSCCEFDDGCVWTNLCTELKEVIDDAAQPSGWMSIDDIENITIYLTLLPDGFTPVVVTQEDRVAVAAEEDRAAATREEIRADVVTDWTSFRFLS
jgi:hypothetical protein